MTIIHIPRYLEAELQAPPTEAEGRFTFTVRKASTGEIVNAAYLDASPNLLLDSGLAMSKTTWTGVIFVGTGNTPPANSNTTLQSYLAHTDTVQVNWNPRSALGGAPDYWVEGSGTWRFGVGAAAGNLTEVGFGRITNNSPFTYELFSRALIVDSAGNPVTLTILSDEVLDVTYTLRGYSNPNNFDSVLTISGVDYAVTTSRWNYSTSGVNPMVAFGFFTATPYLTYGGASIAFNGDITSTTAFSNATLSGSNTVTASNSYVTGQNIVNCNTNAGLNSSNVAGGIKGITYSIGSSNNVPAGIMSTAYRAIITPAIPKDNTKILTFGLSASWGRKT